MDAAGSGERAEREWHRLWTWAAVAEREGHDVQFYGDGQEHTWRQIVQRPEWPNQWSSDYYVMLAPATARTLPMKHRRRVVAQPVGALCFSEALWKATLVLGSPSDTMPQMRRYIDEEIKPDRSHYFGVHFGPSPAVCKMLLDDGMMPAFVADDLDAIRARYGVPEPTRGIGFLGYTENIRLEGGHPTRRSVFMHHAEKGPPFEFYSTWPGQGPPYGKRTVGPGEYLRFMSECRLTMAIIGDRIKCHRHAEATMIGSPLVIADDDLDVLPKHTNENTVLMRDWLDSEAAIAGLDRDWDKLR